MPIISAKIPLQKKIYGVTELNKKSRQMLEGQFNKIQIEGELSNLARPHSGHIYFRLKDRQSQVQCAFFRNKAMFLNFDIQEGMQVVVTATVSLYEARGDYQLIVESMQVAGVGNLQLKFEALKKKLHSEGLFEASSKRALPKLPKQIGIITSPTGAALHDILTTLKRRFPAIPLILYPTQVQGAQAAAQIAQQIKFANEQNCCDVLLLARGGGSLEDLWPFNEEIVAYAIYQSQIPIVSGVGHEVDVTLADYCSDLRAATPTAAAETVTPHINEIFELIQNYRANLYKIINLQVNNKKQQLLYLERRLRSPLSLIQQKHMHVEHLRERLNSCLKQLLNKKQIQLQQKYQRLLKQNPVQLLHNQKTKCQYLEQRLIQAVKQILNNYQQHFKQLCSTLHATSPLATIDRGYSLTLAENKTLITSNKQLALDDTFWVTLKQGKLHAKLIGKKND